MGYGCDRRDHILGWMVEWLWNVWQAQTLRSQSLMTCCCERLRDRNAERDADDGLGSFRGKKDHKCHLCYILYYMTFWSAGSENQLQLTRDSHYRSETLASLGWSMLVSGPDKLAVMKGTSVIDIKSSGNMSSTSPPRNRGPRAPKKSLIQATKLINIYTSPIS